MDYYKYKYKIYCVNFVHLNKEVSFSMFVVLCYVVLCSFFHINCCRLIGEHFHTICVNLNGYKDWVVLFLCYVDMLIEFCSYFVVVCLKFIHVLFSTNCIYKKKKKNKGLFKINCDIETCKY